MPKPGACTVYYDGACPLCRSEIAFYRRRAGADSILWVDVADAAEEDLGPGLNAAQAMSRFHVRLPSGRLQSGAAGFAALWSALPGFHWLGRFATAAPVVWALEWAYQAFLRLRPWLQRRVSSSINC